MDAENGERRRGRAVRNPLPPFRPLDADGLVGIQGHVDIVDPLAEAVDHAGEARHVVGGAGNDQGSLVAVAVVGHAKVILRIDDEEMEFGGHGVLPSLLGDSGPGGRAVKDSGGLNPPEIPA